MNARQQLLGEALSHLNEARRAMIALTAVSSDWSEKIRLGAEFDNVLDACREFAEHQFGLRVPEAHLPRDA